MLTYQLLHAGPLHLIFNMMWLYLIGPIVEPMVGKRRFLVLYAFSGLVGGVAFLVWQMLAHDGSSAVLVGASGSILGVMAAATCVAPRYSIRLWFPPITIQLWVIFVVAVALALLSVRLGYDNAGGDAAPSRRGGRRGWSALRFAADSVQLRPATQDEILEAG